MDSFETDNPFGVDGSFKAVSFLSVSYLFLDGAFVV